MGGARLTRRTFLAAGAGVGVAAALGVASAGSPFAGGSRDLRYWHLFGGGDGVRMREMLDTFAKSGTDVRVDELILPWGRIASPIAVLVFKRAFDAIPTELEESALVDGASHWRIYWQIWLPLSRATIAAVGIFTFVIAWNNFLWPFVVTSAADRMTIPAGLATVLAQYGALYAQQMALAVLGALPLLVVFLLFQRQIVQGIANTGLKG